MSKFTKTFKRNRLKIGCFFIAVSACLLGFSYHNSKLNINNLTCDNIVYAAEELDGIGEETLKNVVNNQPYDSNEQLKRVLGVGDERYRVLTQNYGVYEPCRRGIFLLSCIAFVVCGVFGVILSIYEVARRRTDEKELRESIGLKR